MDEYNRVKLIVEKEQYAKEGVHKGMEGIFWAPSEIVIGLSILTEKYIKTLTEFKGQPK